MKNTKVLMLLMSLSLYAFTTSESIENILRNFQVAYAQEAVAMDYSIQYLTHQDNTEDYEKGSIQFTDQSYYSKRENVISLFDKTYELQIDLDQKQIVVKDMPLNVFEIKNKFPVDSVAIKMIKDQNASLNEDQNSFIISTEWPTYDCAYHFHKTNYHLTKVVYHFQNDPDYKKMIVAFQNIKMGNNPSSLYKSYKDFISISKQGIEGLKAFADYSIIDNRQRDESN